MLGSWLTRVRLSRLRGVNSFDDSYYKERTEEEWKVLKSHTTSKEVKKKKSQLTSEDMLFMQTNVLSAIPECFDLQAPMERIKPRDGPKETSSRPPRTNESVKEKSPNEPYVGSGDSDTLIRSQEERRKIREKEKTNSNENGTKSESLGSSRSSDEITNEPLSSSNGESNYTYQKMRSKIKFKTKTKVRKKRSNSAPPLRRSEHVEEEVSLTEFRRLETKISFSSYVKRKTPIFSFNKTNGKPKFNKLRRSEARNDIKLCGISGFDTDLDDNTDKSVIFNPIYQDEEPGENGSITENTSTLSTSSEPESHVGNNDDVTTDHVKRPPLLRCDHVDEEDEELETTTVNDFEAALILLNNDDTFDSDHVLFRQPITTFDTTHINRDLYIIDEEPENELLDDP